jgi:NADPH:quinone reductase-like Zn-dependent oxidoreductase
MRAAHQSRYGRAEDVIDIQDVAVPRPGPGQVLIEVAGSTTNAMDWHYLTGTPSFLRLQAGFRRPKDPIPGADVAGTVIEVGEGVTALTPGDEVFGEIGRGGFAQYAVADVSALGHRPANLPFEEAATLGVAALTALQGLRDWGGLQPGGRVLINGASGGVGTFAVQIARALGADHVTAVCSSPNVATAASLGADRVIDYTEEDFSSLNDRFDVFFDNAGSKPLGTSRRLLSPDGVFVMVTGEKGRWIRPVDRVLAGTLRSRFWSQRFVSKTAAPSASDSEVLRTMVEAGQIRPVIDRRFRLAQAMEALAYQSTGHARGKVLVVP